MFGLLDDFFENIPILNHLRESVSGQFVITLIIPLYFRLFSDIDIL